MGPSRSRRRRLHFRPFHWSTSRDRPVMPGCLFRQLTRTSVAVFLSLAVDAPIAGAQATLADWDLICFCNSRVSTPHFVVRMDSNGAILYAARISITREQLTRAGVPATSTAIQLLRDWGLLTQRGDTLRTAFPVLGGDRITQLRTDLRAAASAMLPRLRPSVDSITAALVARGTPQAAYAVVFSYVLDHLVWERFGDAAAVPSQIDVEHPFWNGAFWAVNPKRVNAPGTNSYPIDSTSVLVTWTDSTLDLLRPLQAPATVTALARAARAPNAADIPESLRPYALFNRDGAPGFAVVRTSEDHALMHASQSLATQVADGVRAWLRGVSMGSRLDTADPRLALLVTYHEFMWELLDALEASGAVTKPPILRSAPRAELVAPLITVITK